MARKKEQALQVHLTSDSLFDGYVSEADKIKVIDIFQGWTGQCKSILASMKKMKVELQDPRITFATACCDTISALEIFRETSPEPIFLIYFGDTVIDYVRGCNINMMQKKLKSISTDSLDSYNPTTLTFENVLYGTSASTKSSETTLENTRSVESIKSSKSMNQEISVENDIETKEISFFCITTSYLDNCEEILKSLGEKGIEILSSIQHTITNDELAQLYPELVEQEDSADFVSYITSDASQLYLCTRTGEHAVGVIAQIQSLAGSLSQEVAQADEPDSINAKYGNCCFLPAYSAEMMAMGHKLFFPDFNPAQAAPEAAPRGSILELNEYTLYGECSDEVQQNFTNYGCKIVSCDEVEEGAELPEEVESAKHKMVIQCSKSATAMTEFSKDQGLLLG